jgi:hypothetical protein
MNIQEAIESVERQAQSRTRYEGMDLYLDEILVAEIYKLREELDAMRDQFNYIYSFL